MISFYSTNTILTSAMVLPGHVCQHTFQKAMAFHNILFTMVNIRLLASSLERANQGCESVRPKGGSRGPSSRNGCGAPGNYADGFTPPEMFLACATATALAEGPFISPNRTFDGL